MKKRVQFTVGCAFLVLLSFSCGQSDRSKAAIIGTWQGDVESALRDPEIKKAAEGNPMGEFFLEAMGEFYASLAVEITKDTIRIRSQVPGEESRNIDFSYKVVSATDDTVTVKGFPGGGGTASEKYVVTITDKDRLRIVSEKPSDEVPPFIVKRVR